MHAEHRRAEHRRDSQGEVESVEVTNQAFDALLEAEAAGDLAEADMDDFLLATARNMILARGDGETERDKALRALRGFLGDVYREEDFPAVAVVDEEEAERQRRMSERIAEEMR